MLNFPVEKQKKIIIACMALHNFIRDSSLSDELFQVCDEDEEYMPEIDSSEEVIIVVHHQMMLICVHFVISLRTP